MSRNIMWSWRSAMIGGYGLLAVALPTEGAAPEKVGDLPELRTKLAVMRQVTEKYKNFDLALAHGYEIRTACECVTNHPEGPGKPRYLPANYVNNDYVHSGEFDLMKPQQLRYGYDRDGKRQLVGIAYIIRVPGMSAEQSLAKRKAFLPEIDLKHWKLQKAECHYMDGYVIPDVPVKAQCPKRFYDEARTKPIAPLWHPDAWRLFIWAWRENPDGILHHSTSVDICGKYATDWGSRPSHSHQTAR